ncbi:MAG TPA: delta-60 repeat domain-containing protein [Solirubrobacteraceae bacterium]|nr:delta-60 repeat domain-containing protein [Solirubrobacteraceae bacterium]
MLVIVTAAVMMALITMARAAAATPGDLDPAYGTGGKTTVSFAADDLAFASALQSDGSLITVGSTSGAGGHDMAVSRLTPSGAPDPAFGSGGKVTIDFAGGDDTAFAVALAPDGTIIVAGQTSGGAGGSQFAIARLTAGGALDPSFGTGGEATVDFGGTKDGATGAFVTSTGQIVLTGFTDPGGAGDDFAAARLNADGSLDATFGNAGRTTVDFGGNDSGEAAALTPAGQIIISGDTSASGGGDFAVTRLTAAGALDTSFGTGGKAVVDFGGDDSANAVALQSDGGIVLAGQTTAGTGGGDFAVARLTAAGALDTSFGTSGKTLVDFSGTDRGFGVALAPDGGAVVVGASAITGAGTYAIAHLTVAGALDPAFGTGGKATVDFGDGHGDTGRAVAVGPDGKILVSGTTGNLQFGTARLLGVTGGAGTGTGPGGTTPISFPPNPPACHGKITVLNGGRWKCAASGPRIDDGLALAASEVPGFHRTRQGAGPASSALAGVLPTKALTHATRTGAAFSGHGRTLSTASVTLGSVAAARTALGHRSRGFRRLAHVGNQAFIRVTSSKGKASKGKKVKKPKVPTGSVTAIVVLRVRRGIGVIRLTVPRKTGNNARPAAVGYAQTLAARLTRVLSLTTWDRTIDQVQTNGSFSPQVALRAFALVYGPLPGVKVPKNATGAPFDATMVEGMVGRVWSRLSAAQQRAIDQKIGAPHDSASPAVATAASLTFSDKYTALAEHYQSLYLAKVPGAHALTIQAFTSDKPLFTKSGGDALATASPRNSSGDWGSGTPTTCLIKVAPATTAKGAAWEKLVMAHETFHCIEFSILTAWQDRGEWIMEGMADWAETEIEPGLAHLDTGSYSEYLQEPGVPLEMRAYDAMGFWHRVDEVDGNGSLWGKVDSILLAPNDGAAFDEAGGNATDFLQQWASGLRRNGQGGAPWNQKQPFALGVKSPVQEVDDDANVIAYPFSMQLAHVTADGDSPLVQLEPQGGQLRASSSAGGQDLGPITGTTWICTDSDCVCPPDQEGDIPAHTNNNGDIDLAQSAGEGLGATTVTYHSLDEFCEDKDENGGGSGGSGGALDIRQSTNSGVPVIARVTQATCGFTGGGFKFTGTGGGYTLRVVIAGASQPGQYDINSANQQTFLSVTGHGTFRSTVFAAPGLEGHLDGIWQIRPGKKAKKGKRPTWRVSGGAQFIFDSGISTEYIVTPEPGGMTCS